MSGWWTLLVALGVAAGLSSAGNVVVQPAAPTSTPPATNIQYRGDRLFLSSGRSSSPEPVLVVPREQMDAATVGQIIEDLTIMGRIIEKNLSSVIGSVDSPSINAYRRMLLGRGDTGPTVLFSSGGHPKPMYVAGYGALFFLRVDFPLLPPAEGGENPPAKDESDTVWAETRRSILEPDASDRSRSPDGLEKTPYSPERIDMLKSTLTTTMKHAANIRGLEAGEWLTIVVQNTCSQSEVSSAELQNNRTTMTFRATKSDVDSYAKGDLSQTQFEQRLQVISY